MLIDKLTTTAIAGLFDTQIAALQSALDGKPISLIDYPIADTVTDTMITKTTWKSVWTKNGKVVERELETISADGKTFHEIDEGRDEKGKKYRNRLVFERP